MAPKNVGPKKKPSTETTIASGFSAGQLLIVHTKWQMAKWHNGQIIKWPNG